MTGLHTRRSTLFVGGIVLIVLIVGILALALRQPADKQAADTTKPAANSENTQASNKPSNDTKQNNTVNPAESDADKQATADGNSRPITDACKLLTVDAAKQLVGTDAHATTASSTKSLQAANTTITSCTFSGQNGTVQLIIRKPAGHLGVSENSIQFGSDRPAGAVAVNGYGQAAYWNPSNKTLNVLGDNNWYIISRSSNSQSDAQAAAKVLAPGF